MAADHINNISLKTFITLWLCGFIIISIKEEEVRPKTVKEKYLRIVYFLHSLLTFQ